VKLYTFSPTVGAGTATPICYELARWLAPVYTVYILIRGALILLRHNAEAFLRKWIPADELVVFGYNEKSDIFLKNLADDQKKKSVHDDSETQGKFRILLVTDKEMEKEQRLSLEQNGIIIYITDLSNDKDAIDNYKYLRLNHMKKAVLFYEDPTRNLALLQRLRDYKPENLDSCAVWCEDRTMKRMITGYYDQYNLTVFGLADMEATKLFDQDPLYKNCLMTQKPYEKKSSAAELLRHIPQPHLLIVGFGKYGQAVFEKALLTGTLSDRSEVPGYEKLRITIIDREKEWCQDVIHTRYPAIDHICSIHYIDCDIQSSKIEKALNHLPLFTYAAICFSDQTKCAVAVEKLRNYLSAEEVKQEANRLLKDRMQEKITIAVRLKRDHAVTKCLEDCCKKLEKQSERIYQIKTFGNLNEILMENNIFQFYIEQSAKKFHKKYKEQTEKIEKGTQETSDNDTKPEKSEDQLWNDLDYEHKESNRAQVLNQSYFSDLKNQLEGIPDETAIRGKSWKQITDCYKDLDTLASLEHRRWCNYCYCDGYAGYGSKKDEIHIIKKEGETCIGKVHNCLIEDWDTMKKDDAVNGTIIYDIYSVIGYGEKEGGEK
jgi:hypothetical protein